MDQQQCSVKRWIVKGRALPCKNVVIFEFSAKLNKTSDSSLKLLSLPELGVNSRLGTSRIILLDTAGKTHEDSDLSRLFNAYRPQQQSIARQWTRKHEELCNKDFQSGNGKAHMNISSSSLGSLKRVRSHVVQCHDIHHSHQDTSLSASSSFSSSIPVFRRSLGIKHALVPPQSGERSYNAIPTLCASLHSSDSSISQGSTGLDSHKTKQEMPPPRLPKQSEIKFSTSTSRSSMSDNMYVDHVYSFPQASLSSSSNPQESTSRENIDPLSMPGSGHKEHSTVREPTTPLILKEAGCIFLADIPEQYQTMGMLLTFTVEIELQEKRGTLMVDLGHLAKSSQRTSVEIDLSEVLREDAARILQIYPSEHLRLDLTTGLVAGKLPGNSSSVKVQEMPNEIEPADQSRYPGLVTSDYLQYKDMAIYEKETGNVYAHQALNVLMDDISGCDDGEPFSRKQSSASFTGTVLTLEQELAKSLGRAENSIDEFVQTEPKPLAVGTGHFQNAPADTTRPSSVSRVMSSKLPRSSEPSPCLANVCLNADRNFEAQDSSRHRADLHSVNRGFAEKDTIQGGRTTDTALEHGSADYISGIDQKVDHMSPDPIVLIQSSTMPCQKAQHLISVAEQSPRSAVQQKPSDKTCIDHRKLVANQFAIAASVCCTNGAINGGSPTLELERRSRSTTSGTSTEETEDDTAQTTTSEPVIHREQEPLPGEQEFSNGCRTHSHRMEATEIVLEDTASDAEISSHERAGTGGNIHMHLPHKMYCDQDSSTRADSITSFPSPAAITTAEISVDSAFGTHADNYHTPQPCFEGATYRCSTPMCRRISLSSCHSDDHLLEVLGPNGALASPKDYGARWQRIIDRPSSASNVPLIFKTHKISSRSEAKPRTLHGYSSNPILKSKEFSHSLGTIRLPEYNSVVKVDLTPSSSQQKYPILTCFFVLTFTEVFYPHLGPTMMTVDVRGPKNITIMMARVNDESVPWKHICIDDLSTDIQSHTVQVPHSGFSIGQAFCLVTNCVLEGFDDYAIIKLPTVYLSGTKPSTEDILLARMKPPLYTTFDPEGIADWIHLRSHKDELFRWKFERINLPGRSFPPLQIHLMTLNRVWPRQVSQLAFSAYVSGLSVRVTASAQFESNHCLNMSVHATIMRQRKALDAESLIRLQMPPNTEYKTIEILGCSTICYEGLQNELIIMDTETSELRQQVELFLEVEIKGSACVGGVDGYQTLLPSSIDLGISKYSVTLCPYIHLLDTIDMLDEKNVETYVVETLSSGAEILNLPPRAVPRIRFNVVPQARNPARKVIHADEPVPSSATLEDMKLAAGTSGAFDSLDTVDANSSSPSRPSPDSAAIGDGSDIGDSTQLLLNSHKMRAITVLGVLACMILVLYQVEVQNDLFDLRKDFTELSSMYHEVQQQLGFLIKAQVKSLNAIKTLQQAPDIYYQMIQDHAVDSATNLKDAADQIYEGTRELAIEQIEDTTQTLDIMEQLAVSSKGKFEIDPREKEAFQRALFQWIW